MEVTLRNVGKSNFNDLKYTFIYCNPKQNKFSIFNFQEIPQKQTSDINFIHVNFFCLSKTIQLKNIKSVKPFSKIFDFLKWFHVFSSVLYTSKICEIFVLNIYLTESTCGLRFKIYTHTHTHAHIHTFLKYIF